ncbi:DUF5677 domain-containing protein [Butyrivibrio sp. LB2008]|uniref:DUF5677 domain-containing protein n=1 Tax=Butyrivibrio sp. LB2008 TaxID=1408305 RepID=UPI0012DD4B2E|nr:DUF5677 domain-containing protein [Butyrivibrio sp. LB2008]
MSPVDDNKSWTYGRLPEYIWIALIFHKYGRQEGFRRLSPILRAIKEKTSLTHIRMSDILLASEAEKECVFTALLDYVGIDCMAPLTVVISGEIDSMFALKFSNSMLIDERVKIIQDCMKKVMGHNSKGATDIRYVPLVYSLICGKLHMKKEQGDLLFKYQFEHNSAEEMELIGALIRSCELVLLSNEKANDDYINVFWNAISELTECDLYIMGFDKEKEDTKKYYELVKDIFYYFQQLYEACDPLDKRMKVLLGIATYSFKRLEEAEMHNLYNAISGRSIIRSMIENYIMMKYMVMLEKDNSSIWDEFETYGIGQYKLVLARHRECENKREAHVDTHILEAIVNEYKFEEFQDMDTRYFKNDNIREKASKVDEKDLFGLYYDYDSAFEHGLWGAIRESSMLKCDNPAHQYHCVPNVNEEVTLKSIFNDCVYVMNKTIHFLDSVYGVPESKIGEIDNYEHTLVGETN